MVAVGLTMFEILGWGESGWGAAGFGEVVEGGGVLVCEGEGDGATVVGGEGGVAGVVTAGIVMNASGGYRL